MNKTIIVLLALLSGTAHAADRLACQTAGIVTKCPGDAQLAAGSVLQSAFVPWSAAPAGSIPNSALVTAPQAGSADLTALSSFGSGLGIPVRTATTPTWSISTTLTGVTISCASNTCSNIANSALLAGIDALKVGSGIVSNAEYDYLDGVTSPIQTQIDGLGVLVNLLVNDGYTLFLHRTASDIATYETLRSEPAAGLEKIDTVNVTNGTGPVLLGAYATDPGVPGVGTLPSGMWGFREFASVNNTGGTSTILVRVYSRTVGGTETLLFQSTSPTLTTTSASLYYWIYTQTNDIALDPTDRIVVKFYGQTTSGAVRSVSHYYEGSTHASWLSTPMPGPIPVSGAQAQIVATPATQTGQVALRSLTTDYLPLTGVSAGSYPTAGQIPTFSVNANGLLTAAGSTTTLTAPTISGPTLSGTVLGTYTFGGTPTFPATAVSAGAYPTAGLIPTFTVGADGRLTAAGSASSLSGVTINCSSNTCSNVSLTAAVTGVLPVANGGTNSSTALNNDRAVVTSGGKYVETSSTCIAGTVLAGGSPPDCTAAATIATSVTTPRVDATVGSGTLILNALTGNSVQLSVNSTTVETISGSGVSIAQPLDMNSQRVKNVVATSTGDALPYPWITATTATATGATTTLNQTTGVWQDITGMSVSIGAGMHAIIATIRSEISQTVTGGAFVECRFHDGTNPITNSETLTAQANTPSVLEQTTTMIPMLITVGSTTSIKVQCARVFSGTILTSDVPSDSNGRSRILSVKFAP